MHTSLFTWRTLLLSSTAFMLFACSGKNAPVQVKHTLTTSTHTNLNTHAHLPAVVQGTTVRNGTAHYRAVSFQELPSWHNQPFSGSLNVFRNSCIKLGRQASWQNVCTRAAQTANNDQAAKLFFEHNFTPWQVSQNGQRSGTITGYYEPILKGDVRPSQQARYPIYGIPYDLVSLSLPTSLHQSNSTIRVQPISNHEARVQSNGAYTANLSLFPTHNHTAIKGRFVGNQFVPYFTRAEINNGALDNRAPIIAYAENPIELLFLQIQGSGRLKTPSGEYIRLGFAGHNHYPYASVGKYMIQKNYLPASQASMQGIKNWLANNPHRLGEVLAQNPRYIFFRVLSGSPEQGPIGALDVPLTGGFSAAVDKQYITLGAPIFVATTHPDTQQSLNRLMLAQDTGSAIRGAVRVDYFWGYGDAAGSTAGKQKYPGYVWQLLPNGMTPIQK
ncbi:MAG: MltA domain-containing protein [Alysiella sp.]|uniref:murein transglycosylase A n=1 Tax=Alysiella sp. TaxID=1872483 RepID=UPI0026DADDD5|nr:MltA domain-containing protein [Alysiella sp.]MDO4433751.1 MltA domain-containing protein [Alysiella sp.]